jgi:hypothetical protein
LGVGRPAVTVGGLAAPGPRECSLEQEPLTMIRVRTCPGRPAGPGPIVDLGLPRTTMIEDSRERHFQQAAGAHAAGGSYTAPTRWCEHRR